MFVRSAFLFFLGLPTYFLAQTASADSAIWIEMLEICESATLQEIKIAETGYEIAANSSAADGSESTTIIHSSWKVAATLTFENNKPTLCTVFGNPQVVASNSGALIGQLAIHLNEHIDPPKKLAVVFEHGDVFAPSILHCHGREPKFVTAMTVDGEGFLRVSNATFVPEILKDSCR